MVGAGRSVTSREPVPYRRALVHTAVLKYVAEWADDYYPRVLEVGSRDVNGTVRPLIDTDNYVGIDLQDGPGVDLVGDIREFSTVLRFDLVLCLEVLEHDPDPAGLLRTLWGFVRPGGRLLITCATDPREPHSAQDGGPIRDGEHYSNVDPEIVRRMVTETEAALVDLDVDTVAGDLRAVIGRPHGYA